MLTNTNLILDIKNLIASAKQTAIRSVDFQRTVLYWTIGERVCNEEQEGKERANYGEYLIKYLSQQLHPEFGSGFSARQLEKYREFYRTFPIASCLRTQLSWTHYKKLLGIYKKTKETTISLKQIKTIGRLGKSKHFNHDLQPEKSRNFAHFRIQ